MMVRALVFMSLSCVAIVSPPAAPPLSLHLKEATSGSDASFRRRRPLVESFGEAVAEFVQPAEKDRAFLKNPAILLPPSTTKVALFCAGGAVLAIVWVFLWYTCFGGPQRGLSLGSLVEATLCLPCMWADTSAALKLRGFLRAWSYVLFFLTIPIAWNATFAIMDPIYSPVQMWYQVERCVLDAPMRASAGADPHREAVDRCIEQLQQQPLFEKSLIVHTSFIGAFFLLYMVFSLDHCGTRGELREMSEEKTCGSSCGDCAAVFCLGSLAMLEEKQHAADLGLLQKGGKADDAMDRPLHL